MFSFILDSQRIMPDITLLKEDIVSIECIGTNEYKISYDLWRSGKVIVKMLLVDEKVETLWSKTICGVELSNMRLYHPYSEFNSNMANGYINVYKKSDNEICMKVSIADSATNCPLIIEVESENGESRSGIVIN